jgi:hypothetical protein
MAKVRQKQLWNAAVATAFPAAYDDTLDSGPTLQTGATNLLQDLNGIRSQVNKLIHGASPSGSEFWYSTLSTFGVVDLATATRLCSTSLIQTITLAASATSVVLDQTAGETPSENMAIGSVSTAGAVVAALTGAVGGGAELDAVVPGDAGITIQPKNLCALIDMATGEVLTSGGKQIFGLLQVASTAVDGDPFPASASSAQLTLCEVNGTRTALIAPSTPVSAGTFQYVYQQRVQVQDLPEDCTINPTFVDSSASVDVTLTNAVANQGVTDVGQTGTVNWNIADAGSIIWDTDGGENLLTLNPTGGNDIVTIGHGAADVTNFESSTNDFNSGIRVNTTGGETQAILIGVTANTINGAGPLILDPTGDVDISLAATERLHVTQAGDETNALLDLDNSTNGIELYTGTSDPNGLVIGASAGSLFMQDSGASSLVWLNTSVGTGDTWTSLSTGASVEDRNDVYVQQGASPVILTTNAFLNIAGAGGLTWSLRDALGVDAFAVTDGSASDSTDVTLSADSINLTALQPTAAGTGGVVNVFGGTGGTGDSAGGAVTVRGGVGGSVNGAGGALALDGGAGSGTGLAGDVQIGSTGANNVTVEADASFTVDAGTNFSIDGITDSNVTITGNNAGTISLTLDSVNAGAGKGHILVPATTDQVRVLAGPGDSAIGLTVQNSFEVVAGDSDFFLGISAGKSVFHMEDAGLVGGIGWAIRNNSLAGDLTIETVSSTTTAGGGVTIKAGGSTTAGADSAGELILEGGTLGGTSTGAAGDVTLRAGSDATAAGTGTHGVVNIEGPAGSNVTEEDAIAVFTNKGGSGETISLFTGTSVPKDLVTAPAGSMFLRDGSSVGELYINQDDATNWLAVTMGGQPQDAYAAAPVIVDDDLPLITLSPIPVTAESVNLAINGVTQDRGSGLDYTVNLTNGEVTLLADTGTAVDTDTSDRVEVHYLG